MQAMATLPIVLSRARYAEDSLEEACGRGVKQYVILGAGMDTFAFRHPELEGRLQVFEVDHPATQAFKRNRLAELGWEQPAHLHFIPVDFTRESLSGVLARSAYDPRVPSFFSWLGVTMYLDLQSVLTTLGAIADLATPGSAVVFDYLDTDAYIPGRAAKRVQVMMEDVRRLGEPMMTGFDPAAMATDLARAGLRLDDNLGPSDIQSRYFQGRTDGYHACEHAHIARAMVE
jgi:methyltransferase (TIGR00027 family)